jgi:glycosyltransferase involved in cell wall biosynthesis
MRIGIDVRRMYGRRTGVGVYIASLVKSLIEIDDKNTYHFFLAGDKNFRALDALIKEFFLKQFILPVILFIRRIDVFYCPNPPVPFFAPCPSVVTIHDVEVRPKSEWFNRIWLLLYRFTALKAAKIIVPSLNTKKDVVKILHVPEDKVVVLYNGIEHGKFKPLNGEFAKEYVKNKYGVKGAFILSVVGTFTPRKNIQTLIDTYDKLPAETKSQYRLVIVGNKEGSLYNKMLQTIDRLNLEDRVILTGYVPSGDLPLLYNAADLFVFLSLHEGFGLTVLEAMSCGTSVLASKTSSLPEIIGDAGVVVNPLDVDEISKVMLHMLKDKPLRERLGRNGLKRASLFSWQKAAVSLLTIFEGLAETSDSGRIR